MHRSFRLRSDTRRRVVWLALLLLVWQQLAVAAYACAMPPSTAMPGVGQMAMEAACPSMQGEHGHSPVCQAHCHPDHAAQPDARAGTVPPSLFAALPVDPPALAANLGSITGAPERLYRLRAPPPPASLLFCSLLI
jgi:hypothetical protein